jgi:hypothetical protein
MSPISVSHTDLSWNHTITFDLGLVIPPGIVVYVSVSYTVDC